MPIKNIYAMTSQAIAAEIGERIERLRLEQNLTQAEVAEAVGITAKTYRNLIAGGGKFETLIEVLRVLGQLELVGNFIPEVGFSPLELAKLKGKQRQRASRKRAAGERGEGTAEELDW